MRLWIPSMMAGLTLCGVIGAEPEYEIEPAEMSAVKRDMVEWLDSNESRFFSLGDRIWRTPETSLQELKSSKLLAAALEDAGFAVQRGIADMPTAFMAEYGNGRPIIGILAEYDALPGLSQQAVPTRRAVTEGAPGHGCGHNLFGAASTAAALALKRTMEREDVDGTIRLYGTPAEENYSGKTYMARDGWFDDLDAVVHWHPATETTVPQVSTQALNGVEIEFTGQSAHAASAPWSGRSALDAVELLNIAMNYLREHTKLTTRIHYVITNGGAAPNIVPETASVWYMIRDSERSGVEALQERLLDAAKGAALMTGTTYEVRILEAPWHLLVNEVGSKVMFSNLRAIGAPAFTTDEQVFARKIQQELDVEPRGLSTEIKPMHPPESVSGTTDVGDVSWIAPTVGLEVATAALGDPWHHWSTVATSGMSIGHKGLIVAAKTLAATGLDLLQKPRLLSEMQAEWKVKTDGIRYESAIPVGQRPPRP